MASLRNANSCFGVYGLKNPWEWNNQEERLCNLWFNSLQNSGFWDSFSFQPVELFSKFERKKLGPLNSNALVGNIVI